MVGIYWLKDGVQIAPVKSLGGQETYNKEKYPYFTAKRSGKMNWKKNKPVNSAGNMHPFLRCTSRRWQHDTRWSLTLLRWSLVGCVSNRKSARKIETLAGKIHRISTALQTLYEWFFMRKRKQTSPGTDWRSDSRARTFVAHHIHPACGWIAQQMRVHASRRAMRTITWLHGNGKINLPRVYPLSAQLEGRCEAVANIISLQLNQRTWLQSKTAPVGSSKDGRGNAHRLPCFSSCTEWVWFKRWKING